MSEDFTLCESIEEYATDSFTWHIRKLTTKGRNFDGGADTKSLCGRKMAYDLDIYISQFELPHCCQKCAKIFRCIDMQDYLQSPVDVNEQVINGFKQKEKKKYSTTRKIELS